MGDPGKWTSEELIQIEAKLQNPNDNHSPSEHIAKTHSNP